MPIGDFPQSISTGYVPHPAQSQSILQRIDELERVVGILRDHVAEPVTIWESPWPLGRHPWYIPMATVPMATDRPTINLPDLAAGALICSENEEHVG